MERTDPRQLELQRIQEIVDLAAGSRRRTLFYLMAEILIDELSRAG